MTDTGVLAPPDSLTFTVLGIPRPQGSMRLLGVTGDGRAKLRYPDSVIVWRGDVVAAAIRALDGRPAMLAPVAVWLTFQLPRPRNHYGTGRNVGRLKESAPRFPSTTPDLDKLVRAILDGLTVAGCWRDDGQVVELHARKNYSHTPESTCADVLVNDVSAPL